MFNREWISHSTSGTALSSDSYPGLFIRTDTIADKETLKIGVKINDGVTKVVGLRIDNYEGREDKFFLGDLSGPKRHVPDLERAGVEESVNYYLRTYQSDSGVSAYIAVTHGEENKVVHICSLFFEKVSTDGSPRIELSLIS